MNSGYDYDIEALEEIMKDYSSEEDDLIDNVLFQVFEEDDDVYAIFDDMLRSAGYDGIIAGEEIIAFEPNQIKSIDNKNPTDSDDINEEI